MLRWLLARDPSQKAVCGSGHASDIHEWLTVLPRSDFPSKIFQMVSFKYVFETQRGKIIQCFIKKQKAVVQSP